MNCPRHSSAAVSASTSSCPTWSGSGRSCLAHLGGTDPDLVTKVLDEFRGRRDSGRLLATDQLLNAIFLIAWSKIPEGVDRELLLNAILRELGRT